VPALGLGFAVLTRPTLAHHRHEHALLERSADVVAWVQNSEIDVRVGVRYPLTEARRVHEELLARGTTGASLLLPA
jgi:NADPH2:quinone reductase